MDIQSLLVVMALTGFSALLGLALGRMIFYWRNR